MAGIDPHRPLPLSPLPSALLLLEPHDKNASSARGNMWMLKAIPEFYHDLHDFLYQEHMV